MQEVEVVLPEQEAVSQLIQQFATIWQVEPITPQVLQLELSQDGPVRQELPTLQHLQEPEQAAKTFSDKNKDRETKKMNKNRDFLFILLFFLIL